MTSLILHALVFLMCASALTILFSSNVFKSVIYLLISLLSLAGLYVLLSAEFLAITQIVMYAGGVVILILFAVVLTNPDKGNPLTSGTHHKLVGTILGVCIFYLLARAAGDTLDPSSLAGTPTDSVTETGVNLITGYAAAFEVTGILILMSLVGAALIASNKSEHGND